MRWEDESYVKLYTRDTATWFAMNWQAKALLPLLMRRLDKAGLLEFGDAGREAMAGMVGLPWEVVEPGLGSLERLKVIAWHGDTLEMVNFEEAQEARKSDPLRKREQRQRAKDKARSHDVTRSHTASESVTPSHSPTPASASTPAQLESKSIAGDTHPPPRAVRKRREGRPPDARWMAIKLALCADFEALGLGKYGFNGAKDGEALKWLIAQAPDEEIRARWKRGLSADGWLQVRTLAQLRAKWNDLAEARAPPVRDLRDKFPDESQARLRPFSEIADEVRNAASG